MITLPSHVKDVSFIMTFSRLNEGRLEEAAIDASSADSITRAATLITLSLATSLGAVP